MDEKEIEETLKKFCGKQVVVVLLEYNLPSLVVRIEGKLEYYGKIDG